jgi:hypothetical protein
VGVLRFQVGGKERERVLVEVLNTTGDGWLRSIVEVEVGAFRASYPCHFDGGAFQRFAAELRVLHSSLKGKATFSSYEGQLELELVGDGLGHLQVKGEAMDVAGTGNTLSFRLGGMDQTELPELFRDVEAIWSAYPQRVA